MKIINNNNKPVLNIDASPMASNALSYKQQFKVHEKQFGSTTQGTMKTSSTIVHRILIRVPFGQVKRHQPAFKLLQDNNCFLREHLWDEHVWDVHQIGFVTAYKPKYYSPEKVTTSVRARLCKAMPRAKVPKFQMVLKTHKITHHERTSSTQAFTIEVPFGSVQHLLPIIKEVTKDTKEFVPFQMRRKNPDAFQGAIRYQNHLLANQHVIMVNNLGMDAMYYLTNRIQAISGVRDVIPTRKVMDNGKFYILVDKNAAAGVRESLKNRFDRWYHEVVPDDAKPKTGQFEGPPEIGTPRSDGFSNGENSWITSSTKNFMSFSVTGMETSMEDYDTSNLDGAAKDQHTVRSTYSDEQTSKHGIPGRTYASYASATTSDQVSGMTEPDQPRDVKHEELREKIATLEAMLVQLCQQVKQLTDVSAQQQSPSDLEDYAHHHGKRIDRKESPRKHKKAQQFSAHPSVEEDTKESAPMTEDHLTA